MSDPGPAEQLAAAVEAYTSKYLLDERESVEYCWDEEHFSAVNWLFDALEAYQGSSPRRQENDPASATRLNGEAL